MNTQKEFVPTKVHKIFSIALPILMVLSTVVVFETTGFLPSAFFVSYRLFSSGICHMMNSNYLYQSFLWMVL